MTTQILVLAKTPAPGNVKTRLCPPCTPAQAARLAAASLHDTTDIVTRTPAAARVLVVDGPLPAPPGWARVAQRGGPLGERLAHAFTDSAIPGLAALLIGMDTPQVNSGLLGEAGKRLESGGTDAVLGSAEDGGWWALGLRDPAHAEVLRDVPMSRSDTGALTLAALHERGLCVAHLPVLTDVDTMTDAYAVAPLCPPGSRFARAVAAFRTAKAAA